MDLQMMRLVELFLTKLTMRFSHVQERMLLQHSPLTVWVEVSQNEVLLTHFLSCERSQFLPLLMKKVSVPDSSMPVIQAGFANGKLLLRTCLSVQDPMEIWCQTYYRQRDILMKVSGIKK